MLRQSLLAVPLSMRPWRPESGLSLPMLCDSMPFTKKVVFIWIAISICIVVLMRFFQRMALPLSTRRIKRSLACRQPSLWVLRAMRSARRCLNIIRTAISRIRMALSMIRFHLIRCRLWRSLSDGR